MARPFLMAARVKVEVPVLMVTVVDAADAVAAAAEVVVAEVGVAAVVGEAAEVVVRAV